MSGDFAERLAAVDDAIADGSSKRTGDERATTGETRRSASGEGCGLDECERDGPLGDSGADSRTSEPNAAASESGVDADVVALADRVAELEAAVQALRGYAGSVRAVNDRVEERADAAVATAEDCRDRLAALERRVEAADDRGGEPRRRRGESAGDPHRGRSDAETGPTRRRTADEARDGATEVPWPPAAPRAPYESVDADDDPEQSGLLARLRNAL